MNGGWTRQERTSFVPAPARGKLLFSLCLLMAGLLAGSARAQDSDEQEHERVAARLDDERTALSSLLDQKSEVLAVLDALEQLSRSSSARVSALEKESRGLEAQVALAHRQAERSRQALDQQLARLSPRLQLMYRSHHSNRLDLLLSAQDFASMVRRSRALSTLIGQDLAMLEQANALATFSERSQRRLERLQEGAAMQLEVLRTESALAKLRRASFSELLASIQGEAKQSGRLVRDLERAEAQLQGMVGQMEASASSAGFRLLKGKLPYPVRGLIEVGFGRVLNPRFNTVTVQKGVDFRVRAGTPVKAIAPGKIAYAGWLKGYGNLVIVDQGGGYHTLVAHLESLSVRPGDEVSPGIELGAVGDTGSLKGPYLYFEVRQNGEAIDPAPWLDEEAQLP